MMPRQTTLARLKRAVRPISLQITLSPEEARLLAQECEKSGREPQREIRERLVQRAGGTSRGKAVAMVGATIEARLSRMEEKHDHAREAAGIRDELIGVSLDRLSYRIHETGQLLAELMHGTAGERSRVHQKLLS